MRDQFTRLCVSPIDPRRPPREPCSALPLPCLNNDQTSSSTDADSSLFSPFSTEIQPKQLVIDHNRVGPGYDFQARPFQCALEDCDKAFARKSDLQRHIKIHTGDRPYICLYRGCGKTFIQKSALTVHTRVHTGERPHHCAECLKAFADSSSLARHRRIHTGSRPYECKVAGCGRPFARRITFLRHFKKQHPTLPQPPASSAVRQSSAFRNRTVFAPGPPGPDGHPQYFIPTPSTSGAPHAFAAPYPPEDAATSLRRGVTGAHNSDQFLGRQSQFAISGQQTPLSAGYHQPLSRIHYTSSTPYHQFEGRSASSRDLHTPGLPQNGTPGDGPIFLQTQSDYHRLRLQQFTPGADSSVDASQTHWVPVTPSGNRGMRYFQSQANVDSTVTPGSLGPPRYHYFMPVASGNVEDGFDQSQLAGPVSQSTHLRPSYLQPPSTSPSGSQHVSSSDPDTASYQQTSPFTQSEELRDISPDPLVDVHCIPSFSYQPSNGPPISMPYSTLGVRQFNPLTQGPPQIPSVTPHFNHLHSAPPILHRFHSMPVVHTSTGWSDVELYHGPGGYGNAHSIGGGRSGEDEEWEAMQDELLSRDVSESAEEEAGMGQASGPLAESRLPSHWSAPIVFPAPPARYPQSGGRVPSTSSSSSASSGFVPASLDSNSSDSRPAISVFTQSNHPMAMTPIQPYGLYPTPITSANMTWHGHYTKYPISASPASMKSLVTRHLYSAFAPPPELVRQDSTSVRTVGLGIAGVSFDEHVPKLETVADDYTSQTTSVPREEEDELDSEFDMLVKDDSDDEFIPGATKKKSTKKGGKSKVTTRRTSGKVVNE